MPDAKAIEAVLAGDTELFEVLVRRYERLVFSYLFSMTSDIHEVEDVTQEAFVKAYRYLGSFDCSKKFSSWLVVIARNVFLDYRKSDKNTVSSTELVTEVLVSSSQTSEDEPPNLLIKKEKFNELLKMLVDLEGELKEVFMLRVVNEMSYQDIADTLSLPLQTVKNRIFKARKILRAKRDEYKAKLP